MAQCERIYIHWAPCSNDLAPWKHWCTDLRWICQGQPMHIKSCCPSEDQSPLFGAALNLISVFIQFYTFSIQSKDFSWWKLSMLFTNSLVIPIFLKKNMNCFLESLKLCWYCFKNIAAWIRVHALFRAQYQKNMTNTVGLSQYQLLSSVSFFCLNGSLACLLVCVRTCSEFFKYARSIAIKLVQL